MIVHLVGTKAQYIKMAPVISECLRRGLPSTIVYTGQHSETFADLQKNFGLPGPDLTLIDGDEATDRQSFAKWLWGAHQAARKDRFVDLWAKACALVVHGDTASTLLGAWIARRHRLPLVHVEAGLRSFNYMHPFPEEIIRVLVSRITTIHCCPDETAIRNLRRSKVKGELLHTHGNTMIDALRMASISRSGNVASGEPYGIFSLHRHENIFDKRRLADALSLLRQLAALAPIHFVLHPVTVRRLRDGGELEKLEGEPNVILTARMDFFSFNRLLVEAAFVATDGGSNQEECAVFGVPCVVLRRVTERPDGLNDNVLLGDLDQAKILPFVRTALMERKALRPLPDASPAGIIADRLGALSTSRNAVSVP